MRKMYVVRGSEDGNLGVYSNVARAFARANDYLQQNGAVKTVVYFSTDDPTKLREAAGNYANVCAKMKSIGYAEIERDAIGDRTNVSIERFYLNEI